MRHVLEKLNYANRSMKHKLLLYMAAMGFLLAAVLLVSLQIFGRINTPGEELSKSMSIQMEVFRSDMASLWRNVSGMSTPVSYTHLRPAKCCRSAACTRCCFRP